MSEQDRLYNLCSITHKDLEAEVGRPIPADKMQAWMDAMKSRLMESLFDEIDDMLDYESEDPELQRLLKAAHDAEEAKDAAYAVAFADPVCRAIVDKARDDRHAAQDALRESDAHKTYQALVSASYAAEQAAMGPYIDAAKLAHAKAAKEFRDYQGRKTRPADWSTDTKDDFEYVSKDIVHPDGTIEHIDFIRQPKKG